MTITFDEIKTLATQLTRADKLRLMDELAAQVGQAVPQSDDLAAPPTPTANDAWAKINQLRAELARDYPQADYGAQLEADRAERDANVRGHRDVHC